MASVVSTTSVVESTVINAPLSHIWSYIKLKDFDKFYTGMTKSEVIKDGNGDTDVVKWEFQDGSALKVKQEEYSNINHYMAFNIISCEPYKLPYTSVLSTIRLYAITSGSGEGSTFVEWCGHYSSDAAAAVVEHGKIMRRGALADLSKAAEKK